MPRKGMPKDLQEFLRGLGERLRELRRQSSWTQKELAQRLGVDWAVVRNYEQGLTQPPAFTLYRLARVFNVSVDHLVGSPGGQDQVFHDKELLEFCRRADSLDFLRRGLLKEFIDTLLLKASLEHPSRIGVSRRA